MPDKQTLTILGSTGSIGTSTLDVVARHPDRFSVYALTAHSRLDDLAKQCIQFKPQMAVVATETDAQSLQQRLQKEAVSTEVLWGQEGLCEVASSSDVETVMAAIVGAAGLTPTLSAATAGKKVLLANKEALVMAGKLFMDAVRDNGARLLPIDSEHNAIFQCLPADFSTLNNAGIRRLLLTGSGGPFRQTPLEDLQSVTPEQACAHPNWSMGRKISVDSATMMNKGLELIEACWLFNTNHERIDIVIHPQSVVHSMVEYADGSVLAQLGNPDMRTPIAHALAWPERIDSGVASLDIFAAARLDFEPPDYQRFPCLRLATEAVTAGGTAPAILNAANEVAVASFLDGQLRFVDIPAVIEEVLQRVEVTEPAAISEVQQADMKSRQLAAVQVRAKA